MQVHQLMTRKPVYCRENDSMDDAARIMWDADCGFVPVIDFDHRVVGVLTDRDALMAAHFQGQRLADVSVRVAMSARVIACRADDPIERAEASMREHQIRRLVVLDSEHRLQGVLSLNDLATKGAPRLELAETLSAISTPRANAFAAE